MGYLNNEVFCIAGNLYVFYQVKKTGFETKIYLIKYVLFLWGSYLFPVLNKIFGSKNILWFKK